MNNTWKIDPNAPKGVLTCLFYRTVMRQMAFRQAVNNSPDMFRKVLNGGLTDADHQELNRRFEALLPDHLHA